MISEQTKELATNMFSKRLVIYLNNIFDSFTTKEDYDIFCDYVANYILDDYQRSQEIVKIYDENNDLIEITLFQLLINLYLLEFNFMFKVKVTRDWLVDVDKQFLTSFHTYVENLCQHKIYPIIKNRKVDTQECFSYILSNLTERMVKLAELLAPITSPTLSLFDISDFCSRNVEFNKLLSTELDDTKPFHQLEKELVDDCKRLKKIILDDGKSCLVPFIESNCLNDQQLQQLLIAVGPRMSSSNVVMNHVMKESYLNGLQNVGDYIAEAEIAAKALIYKKKYVGISGYMSRETNLSGLKLTIDYDTEDCGTQHYINYEVKSKKYLEMIISKNMILPNGKLKEITENDTDLIGQTIRLRSVCCCAHYDRYTVCKACYGNPKTFKKDYRIGGATSTQIENPLSNAVMSVKHHTGTKTKEFNNEELLKLFAINENELILKDIPDIENYSICLRKDYVEDIIDRLENNLDLDTDDDDGDEDDLNGNTVVSKMISELYIETKSYDQFTDEEIRTGSEIQLDGSFLILSENMLNLANVKKIELPIDSVMAVIHLSDFKPGTPIFSIKYVTAEASKYLKELKKVIERSKIEWYTNLDDPINDFAQLIIDAGLKDVEMVHFESIIYALTRDPENIMRRPDFSRKDVALNVVNLKTSIFKGDLLSTLIYQEITKILKDVDSFEKDPSIGDGLHDNLFRTSISHDFTYLKRALQKAKVV